MPPAYISSGANANNTFNANGAIYYLIPASTPYNNNSYYPEALGQVLVKTAGVYSSVGLRVTSTTTTTAIFTLRSFKNGSLGNILVTVPPAVTGWFQDLVNTDTLAVNDLYTFRLTCTVESFKSLTYSTVQSIFTASDPDETVSRIIAEEQGGWPYILASGDFYCGIFAQLPFSSTFDTTVTAQRTCVPIDCTARNAYIKVPSNTSNANIVATLQKNSVDTAITITLTAGTTGTFEDSTHTVTFLADDRVNWHFASTVTSGVCYITHVCEEFVSANNAWMLGLGQQNRIYTGGVTYNFCLGGLNQDLGGLTIGQIANEAPLNGSCTGLCIYVSANVTSTNSTLSWMNNGVAGANVITIGATLTGFFDSAGTDNFSVGDELSLQYTVGTGTIQSSNITWIGEIQIAPGTGSIIVIKNTDPPGSSESFSMTATGMSPGSFSLQDGESQAFNDLAIGSGYGVSESPATGWTTTYEVSNGNPHGSITVGDGDIITVTITNTLNATAGSGIYKIVPNKRQDTIYIDPAVGSTEDVKIPDPFVDTAFIGN